METKELQIQIPEGYEIDKEKSTFEKIVFKKKNTKPRSWGEYVAQHGQTHSYYIDNNSTIRICGWANIISSDYWKNVLPSKKIAEAFLAMMQLMSLRQAWIGDWEPDWNDEYLLYKYCIISKRSGFEVYSSIKDIRALSFPTKEMATDFMNTFKDLLEVAKPLI
jgi:hypothetical protein